MNRPNRRLDVWMLALLLALLPCSWAFADGATGQQEALMAVQARSAPLALSGDGEWRLHVDSDHVLHRVSVRDEQLAQRFQLPLKARTLSASVSGQRVAFTSDSSCVGLVDFGSDGAATPTLRWLPSGPAVAPPQNADAPDHKVPGLPADHECGGWLDSMDRAIALSADGRWLATASQVIDVDARHVVATLDAMHPYVLSLEFLPDGKKLLIASAVLGERWEAAAEPSHLQFSVWNLQSGRLDRLISLDEHLDLGVPQAYFHSYSSATGLLFRVDAQRHLRAMAKAPHGDDAPLELVQTGLGACKPVWRPVFPLVAREWQSMVVDPRGRWVAGVRPASRSEAGRQGAGDVVEWLEVFDLGTRRLITKRPFVQSVYGLVALPDGSAILGLTGPEIDQFGFQQEKEGVATGEMFRLDVPLARVKRPQPMSAPWQDACLVEDEVKGARTLQQPGRNARLLWSITATELENLCDYIQQETYSFLMPDQTLWMGSRAGISQIDPLTGRRLKTLPAPYKAKACHLPVPQSGGFISYEGDTLVWRALEAGVAVGRKVIDRRPGWRVRYVRWDEAAGALVVYWVAKPRNRLDGSQDDMLEDMAVVLHHPQTLVKLSEVATTTAGNEMGGDGEPPQPAPCQREAGPQTTGHDWRVSHFGSFRAYECGPAPGQTRTVLWSHIDVHPRVVSSEQDRVRRAWAVADGVAVAQDGNRLQVFDIKRRREMARIGIDQGEMNWDNPVAVHLLPGSALVLVETADTAPSGATQIRLNMYSYR